MDFNAVSVFVKVVEAGSFSGAARLLGMPKTTVSARVAALEQSLGVTLIQRTTRKLHVTEPGLKYFRHCVKAIQALEEGHAELALASNYPKGLFRITAPVDIGHTLLPKIVAAFVDKYPDVQVELLISNRVVDLIGEGVDLAVRAGARKDSSLVGKRFIELSANLWASPAYLAEVGAPTTPAQLSQLKLLAFGTATSVRVFKGKSLTTVPMASRIRCDDLETIKELVMIGSGVGWLPDFLVRREVDEGLLVPALPGWVTQGEGHVYFTYAGHRRASPNVRAFIETALES